MLRVVFAISAFLALCGCELVLLPFAPVMSAIDRAGIVQPIHVVGSAGNTLASSSDPSAELVGTFVVQRSTTKCVAEHPKWEDEQRYINFPIECADGRHGHVQLASGDFVNAGSLRLDVGQISEEESRTQDLDRPRYTKCFGDIDYKNGAADPFQIRCSDYSTTLDTNRGSVPGTERLGAAHVVKISQNMFRTTVWIHAVPK